uniref:Uncharacterized protein n=1 Tax=Peronospora matthiolae TaxID=2874970 RepID=A0AAV1UGJ8_9STRA
MRRQGGVCVELLATCGMTTERPAAAVVPSRWETGGRTDEAGAARFYATGRFLNQQVPPLPVAPLLQR